MIASDASASANDLATIEQFYFSDIIGNEAIAALDECQHTFAFTNTAVAFDDDAAIGNAAVFAA